MKKILLFLTMCFALANAQFYYDKHGECRGAYKDSLMYSKLVGLAERFHGPILVKKPVKGVKPRKNLKKIPEDKIQRTFDVNRDTLNKELWLEVEKNEIFRICVDKPVVAWETSLKSSILNDSCLVFQAPTLVGVESINILFPESDSSRKINLAVSMKYLDFKNEEVLLGFNEYSKIDLFSLGQSKNEDPERLTSVTATYLVDKYPVTNCELTQLLWDSIPGKPVHTHYVLKEIQQDWISRKNASVRNENCAVHDTAANAIPLDLAIRYANLRSIREGLKPYYIISPSDADREKIIPNGYIIFYREMLKDETYFVKVNIDPTSDGYRLPFYYEWMMLARGGDKINKAPWGDSATFKDALKYAKMKNKYSYSEKKTYTHKDACCYSEPVGDLLPNGYGLYDMFGLVPQMVLMEGDFLIVNDGQPACLKGGGYWVSSKLKHERESKLLFPHWERFNYGFFHPGTTMYGAGFRLVRNIGNNAKWSNTRYLDIH